MPNNYYTPSGTPATRSAGSSSAMRAELALIQAAFDKLPTLTGNAGKFTKVNVGATAVDVSSVLTESGGAIAIGGALSVTGGANFDSNTLVVDATNNRVLVGAAASFTTRITVTSLAPSMQTLGGAIATSSFLGARFNNDTSGAGLYLAKSRHATIGSHTIVADADTLGLVSFGGSDGVQITEGARIQATVDGTPGVDSMPSRLRFFVNPGGGTTLTEALQLTADSKATFAGVLAVPNGSAGAPSYSFTNDADTGIYRPGADIIAVTTGGTNRWRVDASGVVLTNGDTAFTTRLGTTNIVPQSQVQGTTVPTSSQLLARFNTDASSPALFLAKSRGASAGTHGLVSENDDFGNISFGGSDGVKIVEGARIRVIAAGGTPGVDAMYGAVAILTNNGSTAPTERFRVKGLGQCRFVPLAADPATLEDGDVWFNSTDAKMRARIGGATVNLH